MSQKDSPRGKEPDKFELKRKLSFVDCSIEEIRDAITSEDPEWRFHTIFWNTILRGTPSPSFRHVQNRTLSFWVKAYNLWQEQGGWNPRKVPQMVNVHQLSKIMLGIRLRVEISGLVRLFDPEGWRRIEVTGFTDMSLERVRIPMAEVMTAGVLASPLIAAKHKLRFIFGIVDWDDTRCLDEQQFAAFIKNVIRGLVAVFGIRQEEEAVPSSDHIARISRRLFERISAMASRRLREIYAAGSLEIKHFMRKAALDRMRPATAPVIMETQHPFADSFKLRHTLRYAALEKWCCREYKDPLAVPYALAIERFTSTSGDMPDEFDKGLDDFFLSHSSAVVVPEEVPLLHSSVMLTRAQVILARQVYQFCRERRSWHLSNDELESLVKLETTDPIFKRFAKAFLEIDKIECRILHGSFNRDFVYLLRKLCPLAHPKHLRMFQGWCDEYDDLMDEQNLVSTSEDVLQTYEDNNQKPILPMSEVLCIKREFHRIDQTNQGFISASDLSREWDIDMDTLHETYAQLDVSGDGFIDLQEFMVLSCPPQYRLPEMDGQARELFGELLVAESTSLSEEHKAKELQYSDLNSCSVGKVHETPESLWPEVDDSIWNGWNAVFDSLDGDKDDLVVLADLQASGLLSHKVCCFVVSVVDPAHKFGFTRRGFLNAMLRAHQCRRTGLAMAAFCTGA